MTAALPASVVLLRNGALAASTALRSVVEDPLTFGVQLGRRFEAARAPLAQLARTASTNDRELVSAWLGGDAARTRALLEELAPAGLSRLAAEVAQAAGRPELIVDDARVHVVARARAAWQLGEASHAIRLLAEHGPASRLHRALRAELALMTPGTRLRWRGEGRAAARRQGRVLHLLTNSLPHTQSGYTVRSHAVLRAQREAGLDPVAMTRVGYPVVVGGLAARDVDVVDGIRYHRTLPPMLARTPDGRLVQQAGAFARLAAQVSPAVIQTTTHYPNAIVAREVAAALGVPWAYEVRGMLEQTWVAGLGSEEARERASASERFALVREREAELANDADVVFTLAERMRDDLAGRGVSRDRIHLVPNGVDADLLDRPHVAAADARAALGLPREGAWVGATSSLVDYEGFDVLVDAVAIARARGADVRLLLVGDGAARPALQARAVRLGDAAVLAGRVPVDEVDAWRAALDVFVVPRLDRDVTRTVAPLKPVEAMAAGIPLLVSALPPLLEIVGDELAASAAVDAGDALALAASIASVLDDDALRAQMVALGLARARTRSWSEIGRTYATLLGPGDL